VANPQEKNSENHRVAVLVGGTSYSIDPLKIPYFQSYIDFQTKSGDELVHGSIPYFDTAFNGIENGFRHCFRQLPIDLEAYHALCETFDFLNVGVLQGKSLDDIISNLKAGKGQYEVEYKYSTFVKGDKQLARDTAFIFLYQLLKGDFEGPYKQAKSLRRTLISLSMKLLTYERPSFTKRRSENAEKQCISMMRVKLKAKVDFLVLPRLGEYVSV
jgi:hypothetical protein